MALSTLSNGEDGSDVRTKLNSAISAIREKTDTSISYSSSLTTSASTVGMDATIRMPLSGALTLNAPTSGSSGQRIRYIFTASGERVITLGSGVLVPTGNTFSGTVASGAVRVLEIELNGSSWLITKNLQFSA